MAEPIPQKTQRNILLVPKQEKTFEPTEAAARILFLDDNPELVETAGNMLAAEGYAVDITSTAGSAIEFLENEFYELMILDYQLAGRAQQELISYVRKNYPAMEIIIVTDTPSVEEAVNIIKMGCFNYIYKPYHFKDLMKFLYTVDEAIERQRCEYRKRLNHIVFGDCQYDFEEILRDYTLLQVLGNGLSGAVFLVQLENGENRAIKILRRHTEAKYQKLYQRFLQEAAILSKLNHPHIIKIYEYGIHPDAQLPYMMMEYAQGGTVYEYLKTHPDLDTKLRIIEEVAEALSEVHSKGVLHRDIKPANILITDEGIVKLTDFGVAHVQDSSITMDNEMLGSPAYIAPEVYSVNMNADERSDLFSLGVVAYELIVGHRPFYADTVAGILQAILQARPAAPRTVRPEIPKDVEIFLSKLLAKNPATRYQTAKEVAKEIRFCRKRLLSTEDLDRDLFTRIRSLFNPSKTDIWSTDPKAIEDK